MVSQMGEVGVAVGVEWSEVGRWSGVGKMESLRVGVLGVWVCCVCVCVPTLKGHMC